MPHVNRQVFNLSRDIILGWPETFNLEGAPDQAMIATKFYINAPCADFCRIRQLRTSRKVNIEFFELDHPFTAIAALPGPPIDPNIWTFSGSLQARITPIVLAPDVPLKLCIAYTGIVPKGALAGKTLRLTVMFIGTEE